MAKKKTRNAPKDLLEEIKRLKKSLSAKKAEAAEHKRERDYAMSELSRIAEKIRTMSSVMRETEENLSITSAKLRESEDKLRKKEEELETEITRGKAALERKQGEVSELREIALILARNME